MDYEKEYKKLKANIKNAYLYAQTESTKAVLENILPELKESEESEDEKIRKAIHIYLDWLDGRNKDYHPKGVYTIKDMIAWLEKQATPQVRTGIEWVNTIDDACDERYAEEYSHGEYCHEQSFKWGFQEGVEWLEKQGQVKESIISQHENKMCKENDEPLTSEDERIRKELIEQVVYIVPNDDEVDSEGNVLPIYQKRIDKYRAWLEKQGEHNKFRDSIQIGDKVTRNEDGVLVNLSQLNRVAKKDEKQGEQKSIDKVEPKFREGDMIIHKELGGDYIHSPHKIIQVDILDKKYRLEGGLVAHFGEQDDYELVEQKTAAWSEEDEQYLLVCKNALAKYQITDKWDANIIFHWLENKIKSLRPQSQWKPSDEQIKALNYVVNLMASSERPTENDLYYNILKSLRQQLKKLK